MDNLKVEQKFAEITRYTEFNETGFFEMEPCDDAVWEFLECLRKRVAVYSYLEGAPDEALEEVAELIGAGIREDFLKLKGLEYGDKIVAGGDTIAITVDQDGNQDYITLSADTRLRGIIRYVDVLRIPDEAGMAWLRTPDTTAGMVPSLSDNVVEFGLVLRIQDASVSLEERGLIATDVPENLSVYLPLEYIGLEMSRVIDR